VIKVSLSLIFFFKTTEKEQALQKKMATRINVRIELRNITVFRFLTTTVNIIVDPSRVQTPIGRPGSGTPIRFQIRGDALTQSGSINLNLAPGVRRILIWIDRSQYGFFGNQSHPAGTVSVQFNSSPPQSMSVDMFHTPVATTAQLMSRPIIVTLPPPGGSGS